MFFVFASIWSTYIWKHILYNSYYTSVYMHMHTQTHTHTHTHRLLNSCGYRFHCFPCGSAGKDSACSAGEPGSVPRSGRSTGEGVGYPLQYSRDSLVAQLVKNLPTRRETWIQSLGLEDPLEKGAAIHSSIPAWRIRSQSVRHDWVTSFVAFATKTSNIPCQCNIIKKPHKSYWARIKLCLRKASKY